MCNSSPECIVTNAALNTMNFDGSGGESNHLNKSSSPTSSYSSSSTSSNDQLDATRNCTECSDGITNVPSRPDHPPHVPTGTTNVLTFYPTMEEFQDFRGYINKIEQCGAHLSCGIAKIVPPPGWHPRPSRKDDYSDMDDFKILSPVEEQVDINSKGTFLKVNKVYKKSLTVKAFKELAHTSKYSAPREMENLKPAEMERFIFNQLTATKPIYGADTEGTLYDPDINEFNMNKLGTILDETREKRQIKGVNTVYLYFGMYKTCFAFHSEDMDLYSINYLHFGAPKYWFAIPQESADRFERMMMQKFPGYAPVCPAFLRHKSFLVTPEILRSMNIPFGTMMQRPNEFIITFPKGYHMGFNLGYNCAESTNFATDRWIDFGKNVVLCRCAKDSVEIDMTDYMQKYRADEFARWKEYWYTPKPTVGLLPVKCKIRALPLRSRYIVRNRSIIKEEKQYDDDRKNWKKLIYPMFASNAPDLELEKKWNKQDALKTPHCAVCFYFKSNNGTNLSAVPDRSRRLFPLSCFTKRDEPLDDELEIEKLYTCSVCQVTVHPSCYGGESEQVPWKCFRCRGKTLALVASISCILCEMRGGALLPANYGCDPAYVHVICALFNRRSFFDKKKGPSHCYVPPPNKYAPRLTGLKHLSAEYIKLEGDQFETSKFQCEVCGYVREGLIKCSVCPDDYQKVEEKNMVDPVMAHVTCGKRAGYVFEYRDFPQCTTMVCGKHDYTTFFGDEEKCDISVNSKVIVSIDEGKRIENAELIGKDTCHHIVVDFLDGTMSENALANDVVSCECVDCDGKYHEPGAMMKVKWPDGKVYDAYYRHTYIGPEFKIRTSTGDVVLSYSSDVYGPDDAVPPEVKRRCQRL
ncbi:unnamed protein product [Auanema sp. JU1783]|nr:unnamed protein product [Auanema sp. JU1783]